MKLKQLFFLPLALMLCAGCLKDTTSNVTVTPPIGSYSGTFIRLHKNAQGVVDTVKGNINLTLDPSTGFTLTGDTSKHAASKGTYNYDSSNILFTDKSAPSTKIHLNGYYVYGANSTQLQIQQSTDTLGVLYDLKKN
jgi:hypothetical protein